MSENEFNKLMDDASKLTREEAIEAMVNPYEYFENTYPYIDTSNLTKQHTQLLDSILCIKKDMEDEYFKTTEENK